MATTLDIITGGYRESNLIGINAAPTAAEQTQGLELLRDILSSVLGYQIGEKLIDWPVGTVNYENGLPGWTQEIWSRPWANHRLVLNLNAPQTIYFPCKPDNGARMAVVDIIGNVGTYNVVLMGNGRNIQGAAQITLNTDSVNRSWIYRADLGDWIVETPVELGGDMPYPSAFDGFFKTKLAMRINPRYGRSMMQESVAELDSMQEKLRAAYRQRVVTPCDLAVQVLGVQVYNAGLGYGRPPAGRWAWM